MSFYYCSQTALCWSQSTVSHLSIVVHDGSQGPLQESEALQLTSTHRRDSLSLVPVLLLQDCEQLFCNAVQFPVSSFSSFNLVYQAAQLPVSLFSSSPHSLILEHPLRMSKATIRTCTDTKHHISPEKHPTKFKDKREHQRIYLMSNQTPHLPETHCQQQHHTQS